MPRAPRCCTAACTRRRRPTARWRWCWRACVSCAARLRKRRISWSRRAARGARPASATWRWRRAPRKWPAIRRRRWWRAGARRRRPRGNSGRRSKPWRAPIVARTTPRSWSTPISGWARRPTSTRGAARPITRSPARWRWKRARRARPSPRSTPPPIAIPTILLVHAGRVMIYRKNQNYAELATALKAIIGLVRSKEAQARLHRQLARVAGEHLNDQKTAHEHYEKSLELAPEDVTTLHAFARLLGEGGKWARAVELREQAAKTAAGTRAATLLCEIGDIYEKRLNDDDSARRSYERALERDGECMQALDVPGDAASAPSRLPELLDVLRRELKLTADRDRQLELHLEMARAADQADGGDSEGGARRLSRSLTHRSGQRGRALGPRAAVPSRRQLGRARRRAQAGAAQRPYRARAVRGAGAPRALGRAGRRARVGAVAARRAQGDRAGSAGAGRSVRAAPEQPRLGGARLASRRRGRSARSAGGAGARAHLRVARPLRRSGGGHRARAVDWRCRRRRVTRRGGWSCGSSSARSASRACRGPSRRRRPTRTRCASIRITAKRWRRWPRSTRRSSAATISTACSICARWRRPIRSSGRASWRRRASCSSAPTISTARWPRTPSRSSSTRARAPASPRSSASAIGARSGARRWSCTRPPSGSSKCSARAPIGSPICTRGAASCSCSISGSRAKRRRRI